MTTRMHLAGLHQRAAAHNVSLAKTHKALSGHFSKLAKCFEKVADQEDASTLYQNIADAHAAAADACTDAASYHLDSGKDLATTAKAAGIADDDDLNKVVPDGVSGVVTRFPGVTAHPRVGAPSGLVDSERVDPALRKMVEIDG